MVLTYDIIVKKFEVSLNKNSAHITLTNFRDKFDLIE